MQFAIILLVILVLACAAGSFITQGQTYDWYASKYNERAAAAIIALRLDDAFHSWWFIGISAFLCLNLLLCNLTRVPRLMKRMEEENRPEVFLELPGDVSEESVTDPEMVFQKLGMKPRSFAADGKEGLFASKNRIGIWGAWVCHLGVLLLILGFGLGQMTKTEYVVYGVPGQTREIGDTGLYLTINDFQIQAREDDSVEQYTADITVWRAPQGSTTMPDSQDASISVNHPARLYGMSLYQNSTGWAARITVSRNGEMLQREAICAGDYLSVADFPDLVVFFVAFYPDYVMVPGSGPMTVSDRPDNPAYLYAAYYQGQMLGMNILTKDEVLTIDDYEVVFDEPQHYTLIQIKHDGFTWLALIGGVGVLAGLFLALYMLPVKVLAIKEDDGTWKMKGFSRKGGAIFRERFNAALQECRDPQQKGTQRETTSDERK